MSSTNAYTGPTFDLYFTHLNGIFSLTVPDVSEDIWRCVEEYDRIYGTDFSDHLCVADILPLDGTRYCAVPVGTWDDVIEWSVCRCPSSPTTWPSATGTDRNSTA